MRYPNVEGKVVSINGEDRASDYFAVYGYFTEDQGSYINVSKTIDAFNGTAYVDYFSARYNYIDGIFIQDPSYLGAEVKDTFYDEGPVRMIQRERTQYYDGFQTQSSSIRPRLAVRIENYEVEGISFAGIPAIIENRDFNASRVKVQGIGTVKMFSSLSSQSLSSEVIYYNVNGKTGGSLSGTPLEEGSAMYNLFLQ